MARKKKSVLAKEERLSKNVDEPVIEELLTTTVIDETMGAELIDPAPVKKSRKRRPKKEDIERPTEDELKAAEPKRYHVVRGGRILHRGAITLMRSGKTFKANDYNVDQLLQQGIELKEI